MTMRYNRGNLNDTLRVACKTSSGETKYVFATAYGYKIENKIPPFKNQDYFRVEKGNIKLIEVSLK